MVEVEVKQVKHRGRVIEYYHPIIVQKKEESIIVQGDAYTIKELFQRHVAGNQITSGVNVDSGNGAQDFSELSPLDFLEGDLTDIDTVNSYVKDYTKRHTEYKQSLKQKQNGNTKQDSQEGNE